MGRRLVTAMTIVVWPIAAWPAGAQSLGVLAQQEAERRATVAQPGKVYTNADLTLDFTVPPPAPAPAPESDPAAAPAPASGSASPVGVTVETGAEPEDRDGVTPRDEQEAQPASDRGEAYWRARASALSSRLSVKNSEIAVLRQRVASFGADASDPERDVAARALTRAVIDLEAFNQEWLRFERQAREQGIPDAWIR
ncbi:MAG: hypothetical protein IT180_12345 [Acidobacteria bacterium]|nr:hypothetical protein [Acidobacteriota bacterium]